MSVKKKTKRDYTSMKSVGVKNIDETFKVYWKKNNNLKLNFVVNRLLLAMVFLTGNFSDKP
jgi:hypothetical protein